jgi:ATP-dependent Clp protease ATP-binding subunit ClpA
LKILSDAIVENRSGLNKPGQPIGSFFLLGPTGTGKTELAKSMAELLFNDEKAMVRFDMSEFKEEHSAALLYGAPPGYVGYEEGGMLVNKIFNIQLKSLHNSLTRLGMNLKISDEAIKNLALNGFSSKYGARQISGVIRSQLARPISKMIVREEVKSGQNLSVEWNSEEEKISWKVD